MRSKLFVTGGLIACSLFTPLHAAASDGAGPEFFENKIRPILASNCLPCHTNSKLGGLRLDSREAMLKGGSTGPALVPGDPDKSLLIIAVKQSGDLKMPKGGKLKKDEIELLSAWVKSGAVWPEATKVATPKKAGITAEQKNFWSFQPVHVTTPPALKDASWAKTEIDRYVLAKLESEGMKPVAAADKRTLIRRATQDLTGLPPTPEEIEAFTQDSSPDAFAKVVDRLLASPHYGERWGRMWLDIARYGEEDYRSLAPMLRGYMPYPFAYLYRDWVIQSLNDDMPWDMFIKSQLAGDLMDEKIRVKTLPGTGFLGLGPWYYDNGAVEITHADERHDRVDAVSRGILGLTVGCARCHDHKYDPIPTRDYYSLASVFANTSYHEYPTVPKAIATEWDKADKRLKDREELLGEFMRTESENLSEMLSLQVSKYMQAAWKITGEPKDPLDKVVNAEKLDYELMQRFIKFLAKPAKFYPNLKAWQEMIARGGTAEEAKKLADEFQATLMDIVFEKREMKEENEIIVDKFTTTPKRRKDRPQKPNEFVTNDDFCPGCGLELKSLPLEKMNLWTDVFMRDLDGTDEQTSFGKFNPGLLVFRGWGLERQLSPERRAYLESLRSEIEKLKKAMPPEYPKVHGVTDEAKIADLQVSLRGSPYNLGEVAPRGFLQVLSKDEPKVFKNGSGRLELAEAIVSQPLAVRVAVNRVWKNHFGTGIVDTPSNFGIMGEKPTNPELLEYLAQFFIDHGYSFKALHREILLSSVYQLSHDLDAANLEKDTNNRLYWRANRRRLDAEQIRDALLAVSGSLDDKVYGPSEELTPGAKRRTVYAKVSRFKLDGYLALFDFPSPSMTAEQRFTTNVPLQRLFFMNSDFVQQQAELIARQVESEPDTPARIQKAYRLIYGRPASADEVKVGVEFLRAEPLRQYEEQKAREKEKEKSKGAAKGDSKGESKPDEVIAKKGVLEPPMEVTPSSMFTGMLPGAKKDEKPMLPVTPWGRYAKILLSSTEFTFVK